MVFYVSKVATPRRNPGGTPAESFSTKIAVFPVNRIPSTHFETPLEPLHVNMIREIKGGENKGGAAAFGRRPSFTLKALY